MNDWNSTQYLKFETQRTQPSIDLVKRIDLSFPHKIVDIGCGPGNSTAVLKAFFPGAEIIGADSSENMLTKAKSNYPDLSFQLCDAEKDLHILGGGYDIVFSNACLQWIPNHDQLIRNLLGLLRKGGILAVQVPMTDKGPLFQIISEITSDSKWGFGSMNLRTSTTLAPEEYFNILSELTEDFELWETVYYHRMPTHKALLEWVKGTRLRPYLNVLNKSDTAEFEQEILNELTRVYPVEKNGEVIFRFPRFFFTAKK